MDATEADRNRVIVLRDFGRCTEAPNQQNSRVVAFQNGGNEATDAERPRPATATTELQRTSLIWLICTGRTD